MKKLFFAIAFVSALSIDRAGAQGWIAQNEGSATLSYQIPCKLPYGGQDQCAVLEVTCDKNSEILARVRPGTPPPGTKPTLRIHEASAHRDITMLVDVCRNGECVDRTDGDVWRYSFREAGQSLARAMTKAQRVSFDAPGITKVDAPRDDVAFRKFSRLCSEWK